MTEKLEKDIEQFKDIRLTATQKIWSYATGMLALCLIFSPARNNIILPIVIVGGAAGATAFVWRDRKPVYSLAKNKIQQIEQRLANLETIVGNDDLDLQNRIKQLESSDQH
ncbi:MAG TPA: hypothetical protein V6D28_30990 [Leptolyngbyaceae cyanobacterium]